LRSHCASGDPAGQSHSGLGAGSRPDVGRAGRRRGAGRDHRQFRAPTWWHHPPVWAVTAPGGPVIAAALGKGDPHARRRRPSTSKAVSHAGRRCGYQELHQFVDTLIIIPNQNRSGSPNEDDLRRCLPTWRTRVLDQVRGYRSDGEAPINSTSRTSVPS
jgi:hypothetical protein